MGKKWKLPGVTHSSSPPLASAKAGASVSATGHHAMQSFWKAHAQEDWRKIAQVIQIYDFFKDFLISANLL